MRTITIEVPDQLPSAVAASDEDLARAFRLAAAISWYDRGLISQGKGAEIAGLTRAGFLPSGYPGGAESRGGEGARCASLMHLR
jgi:hypothetical protein